MGGIPAELSKGEVGRGALVGLVDSLMVGWEFFSARPCRKTSAMAP